VNAPDPRLAAAETAYATAQRKAAPVTQRAPTRTHTVGWQPTCDHSDGSARCTVLDPFSGAGTTGVVALRHDRDFIGIELNPPTRRWPATASTTTARC
jgi:hypothetical protein